MKFKATILGRSWSFVLLKLRDRWGDCSDPNKPRRTIRIEEKQNDKQLIDTTVHEMLHAAGWHIDEEFVEQFAQDVAHVLHDKLNFRRSRDAT
jgi:NRPS condensation-like uncharacterized protein